jgi:hypothetical protein
MERYRPDVTPTAHRDPCMTRDPSGEWFHERDQGWAKLLMHNPHFGRCLDDPKTWAQEFVRADVLLSLERAMRAWGGLDGSR